MEPLTFRIRRSLGNSVRFSFHRWRIGPEVPWCAQGHADSLSVPSDGVLVPHCLSLSHRWKLWVWPLLWTFRSPGKGCRVSVTASGGGTLSISKFPTWSSGFRRGPCCVNCSQHSQMLFFVGHNPFHVNWIYKQEDVPYASMWQHVIHLRKGDMFNG